LSYGLDTLYRTFHRAVAAMQDFIGFSNDFLYWKCNRHQAEICSNINSNRKIRVSFLFHYVPPQNRDFLPFPARHGLARDTGICQQAPNQLNHELRLKGWTD